MRKWPGNKLQRHQSLLDYILRKQVWYTFMNKPINA